MLGKKATHNGYPTAVTPNRIKGLYAITPDLGWSTKQLFNVAETILNNGVRVLQYRDKKSHPALRAEQACALRTLCQKYQCTFIVNDDVALAAECGADGVHLGETDGAISTARKALGEEAIIGASCYNSIERAANMAAAGADYLAFGRFYPSSTKPNAVVAEPNILHQAKDLSLPLVAIGGITPDNAQPLISAGADSVAVIEALFLAPQPAKVARQFAALFTDNA